MITVYRDIFALPFFKNAVITIGTFDGVHLGHLQLIDQMNREATAIGGTAVLITFHPHPKQVIASDKKPIFILNTLKEKSGLLEKAGVQHLVIVPFSREFSEQPAADYISDFLMKSFSPHTIIIGYDHRFGKNRAGDYQLLEAAASVHGFKVKEIPVHVLQNITISSTRIREALLQGDTNTASNLLGYDYFFSGKVIEGNKLGRTIGYPTANLQIEYADKLIPGNGVYAVQVVIESFKNKFRGMMNIGTRPTVDGTKRSIEVNIFDFDATIYGKEIQVTLLARLRDEIKFDGLEALKAQLANDKEMALAVVYK